MNCSLPGSSVHRHYQARILEWVVMPSSRGSSWPRNQTGVSRIAGGFFTSWAAREAHKMARDPLISWTQAVEKQRHPTPVLLPGKSHGQRSLVGCSPWGRWELDTTERLHFHFSLACIGEGNGNPLQCSCLENPRDEGAWWAAVYGVTQSQTRLKRLSSSSSGRRWKRQWQCFPKCYTWSIEGIAIFPACPSVNVCPQYALDPCCPIWAHQTQAAIEYLHLTDPNRNMLSKTHPTLKV